MEHTWRWRVGIALVAAVLGSMIGYLLSLTQGTEPQRWPWAVVGALVAAGVALIAWERIRVWRAHGFQLRQTEQAQQAEAAAAEQAERARQAREAQRRAEQAEQNRRW